MAYNVRIYYYQDGRQVRCYDRPVLSGYRRGSPEDDVIEDTESYEIFPGVGIHAKHHLWKSDFVDGWEYLEPDPAEKEERSRQSSMNRTKQAIFGVARSNPWEYFLTLTFDRNKTDSADFDLVIKRARQWLNNMQKRNCKGLYYLIVPELHADKQHWHLHGLLGGCDGLKLTDSGHKDAQGRTIYNLDNWRYGFSTVTPVEDMARVSGYITKYITKDLCEVTKNKHRYLVSKSCLRAKDVCESMLILDDEDLGVLMSDMSDKITFCKSQSVPAARRNISYYELSD